jgi:molybdopterin/thiamine biosynthesis adenylyltransferase
MPTPSLSSSEKDRYRRHLDLPEVGLAGQTKLKSSKVLIIGAGGLGSPVALYLAAAGVGTLGIVDFDQVALSNLQRQILYLNSDVGKFKATTAAERLRLVNPAITVRPHCLRLDEHNILDLIADYDLLIDGTDNFF